jgi:GAF domain-containing protein
MRDLDDHTRAPLSRHGAPLLALPKPAPELRLTVTHDAASLDAACRLAGAAQHMSGRGTQQATVDAVVTAAQSCLPGFDHVGVSVLDRKGRPLSTAATSTLVGELRSLQLDLGEGPVVDVSRGGPQVTAAPLSHDQRWPAYVPEAVRTWGVRSQLTIPLRGPGQKHLGSLELYSTVHDRIDPAVTQLAPLFAAHAALALHAARTVEELGDALASRSVISQAIGLVMARYSLTEEAAFAFLARASSHSNTKLRVIAERVIAAEKDKALAGRRGGGARRP